MLPPMDHDRLRAIVGGFEGRRIVVLGDVMVDEYLWGRATRISPESPVMVVEVDRETQVPGGAANVAHNLLALGARVSVVGAVGDDATGARLRSMLEQEGADASGLIVDYGRPTTRKTRVVAHSQQVLRLDRERSAAVAEPVRRAMVERLAALVPLADAMLVSDYDKGVVSGPVMSAAMALARSRGAVVAANPKPPNVRLLAGATAVSLNQPEAVAASGGDARFEGDDGIDEAGAELARALAVETLVVTRGARGLSLWTAAGAIHHLPAHPVEVYDVAGAGDTVISALTLGLCCGADVRDAAAVANRAGACVVRKVGVAATTREELLGDW